MPRIAWLTDPHFDQVSTSVFAEFAARLADESFDRLMLTGDIAPSDRVIEQLGRLQVTIDRPIDFVLGNHDFYGGDIASVRQAVAEHCAAHEGLNYLTQCDPLPIGDQVLLVGDDGWGDAWHGDFHGSTVRLADFEWIHDFRNQPVSTWCRTLNRLGTESADRLRAKLSAAAEQTGRVWVLTHVPPFREACWYEGHTTDDNWAPFFVCGAVGQLLREVADQHPGTQFQVLCGHTHHGGEVALTPNLHVRTGQTVLGAPELSGRFDL